SGRQLTMACTNSGAGALTKAGAGVLRLDYSSSCDESHLGDAAQLTLAGGTLELFGGTHSEMVGSTRVAPGASHLQQVVGSAALVLNGISRDPGGTVDFGGGMAGFVKTSASN